MRASEANTFIYVCKGGINEPLPWKTALRSLSLIFLALLCHLCVCVCSVLFTSRLCVFDLDPMPQFNLSVSQSSKSVTVMVEPGDKVRARLCYENNPVCLSRELPPPITVRKV